MSHVNTMDATEGVQDKPGARLASIRESMGFTKEYVAGKLHLRVQLIELLDKDAYDTMPGAVFVKGYLRSYANLLGVDPAPFLEGFNQYHLCDKKMDKSHLWQNKRTTHRGEWVIRSLTALVALSALTAVAMWWHKAKSMDSFATINEPQTIKTAATLPKANMTDVSRLKSMFSLDAANEDLKSG